MDSDLYLLQQKNFLTTVAYNNKTREIAENYLSYIQKYKEYTKQYYNKIKEIFSYYSTSLYDPFDEENNDHIEDNENENENENEDDDLNEDKNIFDLEPDKKNNNIFNNFNESLFIKNDIKANNIEVDLPPIYKMTNIFFKQFKNQINGLKLFLKGIDISIKDFKNALEKIKKENETYKKNYLEIKQDFLQNISCYQKTNKELLTNYSKIESQIAQFSFLKSNGDIYNNNKNVLNINIDNIENDINIKMIELKKKEKDFLNKDVERKNYCINYKNKSDEYVKGLKKNTLLIIENLKLSFEKFLSYYANCYHINYSQLSPDIKKIQEMKNENEYEEIIKQNLIEINDNIVLTSNEKYKPILYDIQILKNKAINQKLYEKLIKNGYDIKLENFELNEDDIFFIVKKMYNFSLINKEEYNIEKENKKLYIIKLVNKMFESIDKRNKIVNDPKISEEKLTKLNQYVETDKDCRIKFLEKLGNKRAEAVLELHNNLFNIIVKLFLIISDAVLKENDMDSAKHLLILAQTFYKNENDEKVYLYHKIFNHQIFQKQDFWNEYINTIILSEIKKRELNEKRLGRKLDEQSINKRNNDILFAQSLTMAECMKNFALNKDQIINIIKPILDNYKVTQENRDSILEFIRKQ